MMIKLGLGHNVKMNRREAIQNARRIGPIAGTNVAIIGYSRYDDTIKTSALEG